MSKSRVCCFLIFVFSLSLLPFGVSAEVTFPDLAREHWAYAAVMTLAEDGTVGGFEDGEFKPEHTVSRAEFVKMIGKGNELRQSAFNDVDASHWGYDYIMSSGLEGVGNSFQPDAPITRGDVLNLIWKRGGSKTEVIAPSVITEQGKNPNAAAWGYIYGVMTGDDGIDLRLGDTLIRAEAAALIVRARSVSDGTPKNNFVDTASPQALELIWNGMKLFDDMTYAPERTITNGEMARAAVRLGSEEFNLTYKGYDTAVPFAHEYARDLYIIGNDCIGADTITADFIDREANVRDTLTALTYNMIRKSHSGVYYGAKGDYYKDAAAIGHPMEDICLTYSYLSGVQLYADGILQSEKAITRKEFACLLLQLDYLIGSQYEVTTEEVNGARVTHNARLSNKVLRYPENYADYQMILDGLPNEVYRAAFADNARNNLPKASYDFAREYDFIFTNMLTDLKNACEKDKNVKLRLTYYPSLVCENGNGATLRVKCEILENSGNLSLEDIFGTHLAAANVPTAQSGTVFFADLVTGQPLADIFLPHDLAVIKQIVWVGTKEQ
ncbi:MAG: S-layer homology domain-containing protein [Clostridiales bacterium]|jgi:hypothetical protein|nr:S-layer homology domain-containing protein [Clostridiales bacterium]